MAGNFGGFYRYQEKNNNWSGGGGGGGVCFGLLDLFCFQFQPNIFFCLTTYPHLPTSPPLTYLSAPLGSLSPLFLSQLALLLLLLLLLLFFSRI